MKARRRHRDNPRHGTLARLHFICARLRANQPLNASDVVERFEVSSKTAWRDFEFLQDRLGYTFTYNRKEHSYRLIWAPTPKL